MRPRLLDLFCGAGGASMGYHRAGFHVTGVDIRLQPHYPFSFVPADALQYVAEHGREYDAIHASPPCQSYSTMSACRPGLTERYARLIPSLRNALIATGVPYVIENVEGSPLQGATMLCGTMFGLSLYRHRLFEASFVLPSPPHATHSTPASRAGHWKPGTIMSVAGHVSPIDHARAIMDINWMTREELSESIPPAYTAYVGGWML